jgi:hypothetical protein
LTSRHRTVALGAGDAENLIVVVLLNLNVIAVEATMKGEISQKAAKPVIPLSPKTKGGTAPW